MGVILYCVSLDLILLELRALVTSTYEIWR